MAALFSSLEKPLLKCLKDQAKCIHAMAPKVIDEISGVDCKGDPGAAKEMKIDEVELMHRVPPLYAPYTGPSLLVETGEMAPNFSLLPVGQRTRMSLTSLLATKPVVLEFISTT